MSPAERIDAVLMASGFSARFKSGNKLLFPFRGKPLARHTLELTAGLGVFGHIYYVYADEAVGALAAGLPVNPILNAHPEHDAGESVRLGVAASDADYYMFFTCDQPLLDGATVRAVLNARRPGYIVEPCTGGRTGNPALFSSAFRAELLALAPGQNARVVKRRHAGQLVRVAVENPLALYDVDTGAALDELERLSQTPIPTEEPDTCV